MNIYIYIYMLVVCIHMYIYIYIHNRTDQNDLAGGSVNLMQVLGSAPPRPKLASAMSAKLYAHVVAVISSMSPCGA